MTTIIREVAKGVTIFSRPYPVQSAFSFGGRSTAIQLKDGGVWVLASTPLDTETKTALEAMGPVKYIVGPNGGHHLYLGEFQEAYPEAKLIAVQAAIDKKGGEGLRFDGAWGKDATGTLYGFETEIQHVYFSGYASKDVAFLHRESKTLIVGDLLFNLPGKEQQPAKKSWISNYGFGIHPSSYIHKFIVKRWWKDIECMKRDAQTVDSWDFERIIPCHGDVIEATGKEAWRRAYADLLK